ncbi:hypothetical protein ABTD84_19370, partial [Acinetobacter baumannii]
PATSTLWMPRCVLTGDALIRCFQVDDLQCGQCGTTVTPARFLPHGTGAWILIQLTCSAAQTSHGAENVN